jgi:hypothetical protein
LVGAGAGTDDHLEYEGPKTRKILN